MAKAKKNQESKVISKKERKELIKDPSWSNIDYKDLFPLARSLKRHIKFFVGPTNSGKTYNAINTLVSFPSGVYLAPLRLLALEGQDEIETRGFPCSFLTGEEREIKKDATFIAQTVETFNFTKKVGAVLIDEIQMLADPNRGWAWTQAIVGAPSELIILTGNLESLPLVKFIAGYLGDTLEVVELTRHTTLSPMEPVSLDQSVDHLEEGTAIICFSRKNVLHHKSMFEKIGRPVSIIYGNLSPEVRREEARKFREGETKYLVSTDAIAMGLNMPIQRVIFSEVTKFNGKETVFLSSSEVKQIAGRAGRFGKYPEGFYTATSKADLSFLNRVMEESDDLPYTLYLKPSLLQMKQISDIFKTTEMTTILKSFKRIVDQMSADHYCSFDVESVMSVAMLVDRFDLTVEEKSLFLEIPVDSGNLRAMNIFEDWIRSYKMGSTISAGDFFGYNPNANSEDSLLAAENNVKLLTAYLWIAQKMPDFAVHREKAKELKNKHNRFIMNCLATDLNASKKCEVCRTPLDVKSNHKKCDDCYHSGQSMSSWGFVNNRGNPFGKVETELKNKNKSGVDSKYEDSMYAIGEEEEK